MDRLDNIDPNWVLEKKRMAVEKLVNRARAGIEVGLPIRKKDGATPEMWEQWYEASDQSIFRNLMNLFGK